MHPEDSKEIAAAIPGAKYFIIEGMGHGMLRFAWPRFIELIGHHKS
jgi:hypothetical protein